MTENELAKKLGYINGDEMLLYGDVCCYDMDSCVRYDSTKEILYKIKNGSLDIWKKDNCRKYIEDNNLLDLFNKVKEMSLFNRLVEIYLYYSNAFLVSIGMIKNLKDKLNDAKEFFDGEKEQELENKLRVIRLSINIWNHKMDYIHFVTSIRLSYEENLKLREIRHNVRKMIDQIYDICYGEPNKK